MSDISAEIYRELTDEYKSRTKASQALADKARAVLPGGDTRTTVFFPPYPSYMVKGRGCRLWDADGNEYLDFQSNYTSLIHGHAHPKINAAVAEELVKGTIYGAPAPIQVDHAGHLCSRVPGLDLVRYCNSGTEATMFALRAARAYTGRELIIKMDGGYHGTHDQAEINLTPDLEAPEGSGVLPGPVVERGVPACTAQGVLAAPFNDAAALEAILKAHSGRVAAVILEPIMGAAGLIPPREGYLAALRELTLEHGALLIFDEVITFRLAVGGFQSLAGVTPDLTCLAKIIGGGMPIGAFGGRAEVMAVFDPSRPESITHGGTFNGNNISLAAGLAGLEMYDAPAVDRLNGLGDRLRAGFKAAFKGNGIAGVISGLGSLLGVHFGAQKAFNARQAVIGSLRHAPLMRMLHLAIVLQGIHEAARGMYITSTPMTEAEIDRAVAAFDQALARVKPAVEADWPELIV